MLQYMIYSYKTRNTSKKHIKLIIKRQRNANEGLLYKSYGAVKPKKIRPSPFISQTRCMQFSAVGIRC